MMDVQRMIKFLSDVVEDIEMSMAEDCLTVPPTDNPTWLAKAGDERDWLLSEIAELEKKHD